ncbi:uncharacterized protein LOC112494523 [Cephus cinctus]|uniref:Uncharacterized protein LOC112494523 n=1 Tax=Cephus cinctus TaxID=211228 RepID=A0AAJ7RKE7_CEPCN|nr:uncharacterized protein LOC112494523 [Cephus cinctus]
MKEEGEKMTRNARTNKFADYVLVFILRGVERNCMMPLTYNFCKSSTSANQLARCIEEIVQAVTNSGFKIVATVCDQGATNVSCINTLLRETRRKYFSEKTQFTGKIQTYGQHIILLYNPPHLIKGIHNNFLTKNIEVFFTNCTDRGRRNDEFYEKMKKFLITPDFIEEINEKLKIVDDEKEEKLKDPEELQEENKYFASWDILDSAYDIDTKVMHNIQKQMPQLNDGHIRKNMQLATQVLSRSVAVFIRFLTNIEVNGETQQPKKERNALRREVTHNSIHTSFWKEAVISMKNNIRFINPVANIPKAVPSLRNWIVTLNGFQRLWQTLQQLGFNKFSPLHVNQDAIENFFGMIRRRNVNPTCMQLESSFKTLLINNLTSAKTIKGNCMNDNTEILFSLRNFALLAQKHGS